MRKINDEFFREFESNTRHIFQTIWENCCEEEQTLLMLIALSISNGRLHNNKQFDLSGIDLIFTQRERELKNLEEQGVIISKTSIENKQLKNVYDFTSSLMERFVIQEIWNTENFDIQKRQRVFLKLMSHEQVDKVTRFTNWLWQHKNELSSAVEISGRLLGGLP
ncbi:hypothetical protein [Brasilonema sennae]|uniref:hypothetical protein n=1 Tax=Brasilonema sennae TaxID=1397703 RepID=UPI001FE52CF4|nr:hypothetical protein [Brasilonema sennae]